jgi:leucyl-tRNA synthetase
MENEYKPEVIEPKWQKFWEEKDFYRAQDFSVPSTSSGPRGLPLGKKTYLLVEFPYPSGEGLHVGHTRSYTAMDAIARKRRMEGENVLFPIGWDAFGLPAENYAIKTGIHPEITTQENIAIYTRQLKSMGLSFDWSRQVNTTDPDYYKWTQWIFVQLFKNGLAYQATIPVNWCPKCLIGLANEEVVGGKCERCGAAAERKKLKQWLLRITKYADRLIDDLETVDFWEKIKVQQREWIGRSVGATIDFKIDGTDEKVGIFTTRTDTIFGVTALVLAPEHSLVGKLINKITNRQEIEKYIDVAQKKSEFERTSLEKERTGVKLEGLFAINPVNNEKIQVWLGDYVIGTYGGGAVMMVPAHDRRDYDFAKKYNLEIKEVIKGGDISKEAFVDYGTLVNSGQFNDLTSQEAIKNISDWLVSNGKAKITVNYKLRDWVFSRQHYWGEPIPIVHCQKCGVVPVPEDQLPVKLPYVEKYQPTGTGESPLAAVTDWVNTNCPKCGGKAKRETDTMPNWAGSNWYYVRYCDSHNDKAIGARRKLDYWLPVDWYNGGMEHTTLHLLYSRFIYKFLFDIGAVPANEPYKKRTSQGMVLAANNQKMSKSRGNVVNPDDIVKKYGADTLRIYELFMGPFDQAIAWSEQGVKGCRKFLGRVWHLVIDCLGNGKSSQEVLRRVHKLNQKIFADIEQLKFNTAVAAFMEFLNFAENDKEKVGKDALERMLLLLSPFAPYVCEELWSRMGHKDSIFKQSWPVADQDFIKEDMVELVIQVNGKLRDKISVPAGIDQEKAVELAKAAKIVQQWIDGKPIKNTVYIKDRLINFVI